MQANFTINVEGMKSAMSNESTVAEMDPKKMKNERDAAAIGEDATAENAAEEPIIGEVVTEESTESTDESAEETADPAAESAKLIEQLRADLAAAEAKSEDLVDKLQRTAAEFQNSRRRQEKQLTDEIQRASSHIVQRLLPVIDDLELAFDNLPADLNETESAWVDGFRQIRKKLDSLLEDQGVTAIPLEGEFDPNRHEAVSSEPSDSVENNHIIQTLRTGYEYKGRVLRPALVRVAA